MLFHGILVE